MNNYKYFLDQILNSERESQNEVEAAHREK